MKKIFVPVFLVLTSVISGCQETETKITKVLGKRVEQAVIIEEVPSNLVCMVNNNFMGVDQIKVVVDGKDYYGCCADCEMKLKNDVTQRTSIDPLTQETVDKSTAIIGKLKNNKVHYFKTKKNLKDYENRYSN